MFNTFLLALIEVVGNALFIVILCLGLPLFIRWCCLVGSVLWEKWQTRRAEKRHERGQARHDRAITNYFEGVGREI